MKLYATTILKFSVVLIHEFARGKVQVINEIIFNLIKNLNEGGILRSWMHSHLSIETDFNAYLIKLFDSLKTAGQIRGFGIYEPPKEMVDLTNQLGKKPPNTAFWLLK